MNIDKLKKALNQLDNINPADPLAYEQALTTFLTIEQLPILVDTVDDGVPIFRSRTHENADFYNNINDIGLTPEHFVRNFARCNRPLQSMFYAAENRPTSFMELINYWSQNKNVGDKINVTIGLWVTKAPMNLVIVTTPNPEKRKSAYDMHHGVAYDAWLNGVPRETQDFTNLFFDYLFEIFRKPANNAPLVYLITTAYTNLALLMTENTADGLSYPSVPFGGQGVNVVLRKSFAQNNLDLRNAMWNELTIGLTNDGQFNFIETGVKQTDKINLENSTIDWT